LQYSRGFLTPLLKRIGENFQWTKECENSFQQLKQLLTNAPILKIVDLDEEFVVFTNACKE
jgi:hypothetical protein